MIGNWNTTEKNILETYDYSQDLIWCNYEGKSVPTIKLTRLYKIDKVYEILDSVNKSKKITIPVTYIRSFINRANGTEFHTHNMSNPTDALEYVDNYYKVLMDDKELTISNLLNGVTFDFYGRPLHNFYTKFDDYDFFYADAVKRMLNNTYNPTLKNSSRTDIVRCQYSVFKKMQSIIKEKNLTKKIKNKATKLAAYLNIPLTLNFLNEIQLDRIDMINTMYPDLSYELPEFWNIYESMRKSYIASVSKNKNKQQSTSIDSSIFSDNM